MRVVFLYCHLHAEVTEALDRHAPAAEKLWVGADDRAPWRALRARWAGEDDLVVVEQHAVLDAAILPAFAACPQPWCPQLSEIAQPRNWNPEALTCVRFRASVQRAVPARVIEAGWGSCFSCGPDGESGRVKPPGGPGCWRHMDGEIIAALTAAGYASHTHTPPVYHYKVHRRGGDCRVVV